MEVKKRDLSGLIAEKAIKEELPSPKEYYGVYQDYQSAGLGWILDMLNIQNPNSETINKIEKSCRKLLKENVDLSTGRINLPVWIQARQLRAWMESETIPVPWYGMAWVLFKAQKVREALRKGLAV